MVEIAQKRRTQIVRKIRFETLYQDCKTDFAGYSKSVHLPFHYAKWHNVKNGRSFLHRKNGSSELKKHHCKPHSSKPF